MRKFLLSLMLVSPLVCKVVYEAHDLQIRIGNDIYRCENEEIICYTTGLLGLRNTLLECKFK